MSAQTSREKCPLCLEEMDLTDKELKPCKCGYEICLWCWHHIMEMDHKDESGGRCPGCRSVYNKDRIMGTSVGNKILKDLCSDKSYLQKEQNKSHKPKYSNVQPPLPEEPNDPSNVRVIQRKLVYIVGMPSEFANPKVLKHNDFLGQYGKIENIVIDNVGANQHIPDSGRVYVTFSREEEAARCIQAVNGYILDGRLLKATFGVTRYCHIWLSNRTCWKQNCSYVHYKAAAEDICTRDDVSVFCSRIHQLMGMDKKSSQHRSGSTLPPPIHCNSRSTIHSGISKDICTIDDKLLPSGAAKNTDLVLATTLRNLSACSQKEHINKQLTSNNDKSQASAQLRNDTSNSNQTISVENGSSDMSLQKPQYVSVVSQGQGGSGRCFTVLTRQGASTDTKPKSTGQVLNGTSTSAKFTLVKNERSDSVTIPRSQYVNPVSQKPEPLNPWALKSAKSHAQTEKKNESSDISSKPIPGNQKQLLENTASNNSTAVYTMSGRPMPSNLSTSDAKYQALARPHNNSGSNGMLISQNQLQLVNQQSEPVSDTVALRANPSLNILNNQVPSSDGKCQNSAQGEPHSLYNKEITKSDNCSNSKPLSAVSFTDMAAPVGKERKKQVCCPPGFEKLQRSSDSGNFVSLNSTCSEPSSTTNALVQDYCSITDQPHIISMVSHCLDDGDFTQNKIFNFSSPPCSTDIIWRDAQFPGTSFSGLSNHTQVSPYPNGFLQCAPTPLSCTSYQRSSYFDGIMDSYMSTGGYDSFHQGTASGMAASNVGKLLQQTSMPSPHHGWTHGNADAGMNRLQVDISYPRGYTLF